MSKQDTEKRIDSMITIERLDDLCDLLVTRRIAVAEAQLHVVDASEDLEELKARIIGDGYADGTIDGSNKQTRDAQEDKLIAESEEVAQARLRVREAKRTLSQVQANLAGTEEKISLYRAFLYQHTRMPR